MIPGMAVRITRPFSDLSGTVRQWALKAERLVVYEHNDDGAERIHCHMLLLGVGCDAERLKQIVKETCPGTIGKGNSFWSFKTKVAKVGQVDDTKCSTFITYMTKGKYDAKYVKGWSEEELEVLKGEWVENTPMECRLYTVFETDAVYQAYVENPTSFEPGSTVRMYADKVDVVAKVARRWAFSQTKFVWTAATSRLAKMVFLTYCMRHGITISDKYRMW